MGYVVIPKDIDISSLPDDVTIKLNESSKLEVNKDNDTIVLNDSNKLALSDFFKSVPFDFNIFDCEVLLPIDTINGWTKENVSGNVHSYTRTESAPSEIKSKWSCVVGLGTTAGSSLIKRNFDLTHINQMSFYHSNFTWQTANFQVYINDTQVFNYTTATASGTPDWQPEKIIDLSSYTGVCEISFRIFRTTSNTTNAGIYFDYVLLSKTSDKQINGN